MLLSEFLKESEKQLTALYPAVEARNMALLLCEDRLGVKSYTAVIDPRYEIAPDALCGLMDDVQRLLKSEPLQYVLGKCEFYGRTFAVSPGVLIPRPETELLVNMALEKPFCRALDLCTGSGCIAWTLALERPEASVTAVDISENALRIAGSQNFKTEKRIEFIRGDILKEPCVSGKYDLIVSNPPYILEKEKLEMRPNVLAWEPSIALFVPDDNPLVFYEAISRWCAVLLSQNGRGIVEINENLGKECELLFKKAGFFDVNVIKDLSNRDRYIAFFKR